MYARFKITGTRPLLMHNGRLADPLDPHAKALKELSAKRNKTDDDLIEMGHREWLGSLYWDDEQGACIPGQMLEATLRDGAKFRKLGKAMTQAVMIDEFTVPLEYDGPRQMAKLWQDLRFSLRAGVKVGQQRVIRTRPKFPIGWSVEFGVEYAEDRVNVEDIDRALMDAGQFIGLGDWRPRYGRFTVERVA